MWKHAVALAVALAARSTQAALDAKSLATQYFGNDAPWYLDRIPFFESSNADITNVYYYRWKIFRAHQRDLGANGYISTEFLNDVSWQTNPWASLNDATGFHLLEGRWCRDRRFKQDYANFMYSANSNTRQYSESMATSVWQGYLVDGVADDKIALLDAMQTVYNAWGDSFDSSKGLYWVEPLRDATEYTISSIDASGGKDGFTGGNSFRPSINSYQYANARAIANLATLKKDQGTADSFNAKAASIRSNVQGSLWNSTFHHFIDRYYVNNTYVRYWDFIRGRELVGFVPWTHDLPEDKTDYAEAWGHILNTSQLAGPHGLRTGEPSYQYYMKQYRYDGASGKPECQWNGPVWPYQTTQVLTGLANFLDHYPKSSGAATITSADYTRLLIQYAKLHYNPKRGGILDLEEDYDGDTGAPIVGLSRSPHYFHSGYVDLVATGLVGIRPRADDVLEVNPLADSTVTFFRFDNAQYHGHNIAVQWDKDGSHYKAAGLQVEIDGKVVASSPNLRRLNVSIPRVAPPAITHPLAKSVQLTSTTSFPVGSVSTKDSDTNAIHSAIDGRIFFFPEADAANGWNSPAGTDGMEIWFQVDFGATTTVSSAEIALFADDSQGFDVPQSYRVQVNTGGSWVDVSNATYGAAVGNGITAATWGAVDVKQIRLVFSPKVGKKVRLVEFKVF